MWTITAHDVEQLRGAGGERFGEFVDSLIRAQAQVGGLPDAEIVTNQRANIRDGGVDTEIRSPVSGDDTGRLGVATCWQYKATSYSRISTPNLSNEIGKWYSAELIGRGFGYRFCIADSMPAPKKHEWEELLRQEAASISADAAAPLVLTAEDLAAWCNRFPALVLRFFKPYLDGVMHFRAWGEAATHVTPRFVQIPEREGLAEQVRQHTDFSAVPASCVISVQGEAGVGKTRLVYETLASAANLGEVTVYADDDRAAERISRVVANDPAARCVVVADECSPEVRERLHRRFSGHSARLRVIAINNTGQRPGFEQPEYWIVRLDDDRLAEVLTDNFPHVPPERRRRYARLAGGFVLMAADLCQRDADISHTGDLAPALLTIDNYYESRLSDNERAVIEAISLLPRVGFKDDKRPELAGLCGILGLREDETILVARRLKNAPGFISFAGRYLYATPQIIARIAFRRAWTRWAEADPSRFLEAVPDELLQPFLDAVARNATEEVRREVGVYFRSWATRLEPANLEQPVAVRRLATLVSVLPGDYAPVLHSLCAEATAQQLAMSGTPPGGGGTSRRTVVWLLERLLRFPEYFRTAEDLLFRLACSESEPDIANNATGIWNQAFQIVLSGTAVPFCDRLDLLEHRLRTSTDAARQLCRDALDQLFTRPMVFRTEYSILGGRIPPAEWQPQTSDESRVCEERAVELLVRLTRDENEELVQVSRDVACRNLRKLLWRGRLPEVRAILGERDLDVELLPRVVESVEDFLLYDAGDDRRPVPFPEGYSREVRQWLDRLPGEDLHRRVVSIVGKERWHHLGEPDLAAWQDQIGTLAAELYEEPARLEAELGWLSSPEARSADLLGQQLGQVDTGGRHLREVIDAAVVSKATQFARGYLHGLLTSNRDRVPDVNQALDERPHDEVAVVVELALAKADDTQAVSRVLGFIREGDLMISAVAPFVHLAAGNELSEEELERLLSVLVEAIEEGDRDAANIATDLVSFALGRVSAEEGLARLGGSTIDLIWRALDGTATLDRTRAHFWGDLVLRLRGLDPLRASRIAVKGLLSSGFMRQEQAEEALEAIGQSAPGDVMLAVGEKMLSPDEGNMFFVGKFPKLFRSLPTEVVVGWLEEHGEEGARRIARHLPLPHISSSGEPVVSELTEFVLTRFESDDRTFREFCIGAHSFQIYAGDIAEQKVREAEVARQFLGHPARRIREWAQHEIEQVEREAAAWRQEEEEFGID